MVEVDISRIKETALRLAKSTEEYKFRYFIREIKPEKEPRIKVLRGFRGVGKTTSLLQLMKDQAIYLSMDNPYVEMFSLYELGKALRLAGNKILLIDEIHRYKKWKRDTKALYDEFPSLSIIVSGSAPLAFEPERRYEIMEIEPLSFREFLYLEGKEIEKSEDWKDHEATLKFVAERSWLYEYYKQYLAGGAFPLYFSYREKTLAAIYNSIKKSIREDALLVADVDSETVIAMERAVILIATSKLGEFSINNFKELLEISKYKAFQTIHLLESMKILRLVKPHGKGPKMLRGEPKLMLYHPNLRKAVCDALKMPADKGAMREELAVFFLDLRGWTVNTIKGKKRNPDYIIEKGKERMVVEIGGPSKSKKQLAGFEGKKLVIEDRQLILLGLM
jgi:predicted AAA+ superfamily ATPase